MLVIPGDARYYEVNKIELLLQVLDRLFGKKLGIRPLGVGLEHLDYADNYTGRGV